MIKFEFPAILLLYYFITFFYYMVEIEFIYFS